ncbi:MAG: tetratricopeptide repeat protein [Phycisphaerae bacterium]
MTVRRWTILLLIAAAALGGCRKDPPAQPDAGEPDSTPQARQQDPKLPPAAPQPAANATEAVMRRIGREILRARAVWARVLRDGLVRLQDAAPSAEKITIDRAGQLYRQGRIDEAIALLAAQLEQTPETWPIQQQYAALLAAAGQFERAADACRRAIELNPSDRASRFNLAVALARQGLTSRAEQVYRELILRDPDDPTAKMGLIGLLLHAGRTDEARTALEELIAQAPELAIARAAMGDLLMDQDQPREAMAQYAALAQIQPDSIENWQSFANAAIQAGSLGRALFAMQRVIELADRIGSGARPLAELALTAAARPPVLLADPSDLVQAQLHAAAAQGRLRWWARQYQSLGDVYLAIARDARASDQLPNALAAWEKSLAIWPDQPELRRRIGRVRQIIETPSDDNQP